MEDCSEEAWKNSCPWPPPTAKHPGNKFRFLERKEKKINQLIPQFVVGCDGVRWSMMITHKQRQHYQGPKAGIREQCPRVIQHLAIWSKCLNDSHPRIPGTALEIGRSKTLTLCEWNPPQQGTFPRKAGDRQDLNYHFLSKTPNRDIYYLKKKFIQYINLSTMYYENINSLYSLGLWILYYFPVFSHQVDYGSFTEWKV